MQTTFPKREGFFSSDRGFGCVFAAFFLWLGLAPLRHGLPVRTWALIPAAVFLLAGLFAPAVLNPAKRAWLRLSVILGRVVNPLVTGLLFASVFVPFGLLLRVLGKDPLRLHFDPAAASYWLPRSDSGAGGMKEQF